MPAAAKRACPRPRCPHVLPCPLHPPSTGWRPVAQRSKAERGYGTAQWEPIRRRVLAEREFCQGRVLFNGRAAECLHPATHVDHVVPKAQGGTDEPENLQALCVRCHQAKTARERARGRR